MKKLKVILFAAFAVPLNAQVGILTPNPQSAFHIDGAKDNNPTGFPTNDQNKNDFSVDSKGFVGIGTHKPTGKFEIIADNEGGGGQNDFYFKGFGNSKDQAMYFVAGNGTKDASTTLNTNDRIGRISFVPVTADFNYANGSSISSSYRGTGTENLSDLAFSTSSVSRLMIDHAGNVGVGTTNPTNKLVVKGANAQPSYTNATFRVDGDSNHVLDIGTFKDYPYGSYISSIDKQGLTLPLVLNPLGANVGIGTNRPTTKLEVIDSNNANSYKGIASFAHSNGTQGLSIGYNGIQSVGSRDNVDLNLNSKGTGNIILMTQATGNVGIGTSAPNPSAILDLSSTTKGFLPPRMTTAQRDSINPKPAGLMIYNTSANIMQYWNGNTWLNYN